MKKDGNMQHNLGQKSHLKNKDNGKNGNNRKKLPEDELIGGVVMLISMMANII